MERHICKRRRVQSMKPNTVLGDTFGGKYAHCLVAADEKRQEKVLRHQVNMEMTSCRTKVDESVGNQEEEAETGEKQCFECEEEGIRERLMRVRSILPGRNGNEIEIEIEEEDALLGELGCYIISLHSHLTLLTSLLQLQQH